MRVASEALEAWWPPTWTPPLLGRRWLAWWIIQEDSQRIFFSSASSISRWPACVGMETSLSASDAAAQDYAKAPWHDMPKAPLSPGGLASYSDSPPLLWHEIDRKSTRLNSSH